MQITRLSEPVLFRNFTWTQSAIKDWEEVWHSLWKMGFMWEWQNSDRYARKRGDIYNLFAVHNDPERLDMAIQLPGLSGILEMHEYLLDLPTDDPEADRATNLIRKWIRKYAERITLDAWG